MTEAAGDQNPLRTWKEQQRRRRSFARRWKILTLAAAVVVVVAALFWGGGDGFFVQWEVSREIAALEKENALIRVQNAQLRDHIRRLDSDMSYIERIARERYGMALPHERVYRVIIPPAPTAGSAGP
ncbi:MAG TPA: septum formation initiator family protein [Candidatus Latescibacteria bacterium]|nr:septum formation initiator family protein [Candidatus Latescibacterota bacterium]HQE61523.1 septum formation initiator family protein [Candidatus Latescibacterota bacterium]HQI76378.1 septum formation initiator family protein [Candidatus Latescibacterota bacterium]HQK22213.1 septum formation initiator family protein [Candidatus Latescibacterota bacterium]HRU23093.1 septum formation initiator family protein [Candidatus Latescibacterota bacterium]